MSRLGRLRPATVRAGWWAWRATGRARRGVESGPLDRIVLPRAPRVGAAGERAVVGVLRRRRATCLESALVRQAMLVARGDEHELVIGVAGPAAGFRAHAWIDGDEVDGAFDELVRQSATRSTGGRLPGRSGRRPAGRP